MDQAMASNGTPEDPSTAAQLPSSSITQEAAATTRTVAEIADHELANLGKRAKRRLERIQKQKEKKLEKKAEKREAKRLKREEQQRLGLAVDLQRGEPNPDPEVAAANKERNRARKSEARAQLYADCQQGPLVVCDMSEEWELAMTVAERASLAQQLMYSYGYNKRALKPARLMVTEEAPRKTYETPPSHPRTHAYPI